MAKPKSPEPSAIDKVNAENAKNEGVLLVIDPVWEAANKPNPETDGPEYAKGVPGWFKEIRSKDVVDEKFPKGVRTIALFPKTSTDIKVAESLVASDEDLRKRVAKAGSLQSLLVREFLDAYQIDRANRIRVAMTDTPEMSRIVARSVKAGAISAADRARMSSELIEKVEYIISLTK